DIKVRREICEKEFPRLRYIDKVCALHVSILEIQLDQHRENREPCVNATDIVVARLSFGMPRN
ncbi:hypothetical protein CEP51_016742, partial [Fusarium floridanum]